MDNSIQQQSATLNYFDRWPKIINHWKLGFIGAILTILIPSEVIVAQKIDSLKLLLNEQSGVERSDVLYELAFEYIDLDNELGLSYARRAMEVATSYGDSVRIIKAGRIKSLAYSRLAQLDSAIDLSTVLLSIAQRHLVFDQTTHLLNILGTAFTYKGNFATALKYHFMSLQIREEHGTKFDISVTLHNIGLVYFKLEDYEKALAYYERALKLKTEIDNKYDLDGLLINMSLCFAYLNKFEKANYYVKKGLESCVGPCTKMQQMSAFFSLGVSSYRLGELKDSETNFLKSYSLAKEIENVRFQLDNLVYLFKLCLKLNELEIAEKYLEETTKLIEPGTPFNIELIKIYKELSTYFGTSKQYEKVIFYQKMYIQLKDSVYNDELTKGLMKIESEYLEREYQTRISAQNSIMALNEEVIFRQRIINIFIILVAILLAAIILILLKRNRYKKKMNILLEQKVKERTLELEQNQNSLHNAIKEQTVFLEKVSTEVKSSLASVKGLCSLGIKDLNDPEAKSYFNRIVNTSDRLLGIVNISKREVNG